MAKQDKKDGTDVKLTIDSTIQKQVYDQMKEDKGLRRDRLIKRLSVFLVVSIAVCKFSAQAASFYADEPDGAYALAGEGSGGTLRSFLQMVRTGRSVSMSTPRPAGKRRMRLQKRTTRQRRKQRLRQKRRQRTPA